MWYRGHLSWDFQNFRINITTQPLSEKPVSHVDTLSLSEKMRQTSSERKCGQRCSNWQITCIFLFYFSVSVIFFCLNILFDLFCCCFFYFTWLNHFENSSSIQTGSYSYIHYETFCPDCEFEGGVTQWSVGRWGFGTAVFEEEQKQQTGGRAFSSHLRERRNTVGYSGKQTFHCYWQNWYCEF